MPEKEGATLENNEVGGRKEVTEFDVEITDLEPVSNSKITYSLGGSKEIGRRLKYSIVGSGDIIGAMEMDEKLVNKSEIKKANLNQWSMKRMKLAKKLSILSLHLHQKKRAMTLTGGDFDVWG